jgi:acylphosphatase
MIVSGRVQGVLFRRATADKAHRLDLTGWVRNRLDGSVEIVAEGKRPNLETLLAWAHRGPPYAGVDGVDVEWEQYQAEFPRFQVR